MNFLDIVDATYYNAGGNVELSVAKPVNYLATINNLSEAVTKTSSKTMKITYTIQNT